MSNAQQDTQQRVKPSYDTLQVVAIVGYFIFTVCSGVLHLPLLPTLAAKLALAAVMLITGVSSMVLYVVCARTPNADTTEEILEADKVLKGIAIAKKVEQQEKRKNGGGGEVKGEESPAEEIEIPKPTIPEADIRYCVRCEKDVHHETKHCMVCNRCCKNFDHHCKWLNNCVGGDNYTTFFVFIVVTLLSVTAYSGLGGYHIVQYFIDDGEMRRELQSIYNSDPEGPSHIIVVSVMCVVELLGLVAVVLLCHLCGIHVYLSYRGISTYSWILEQRAQQASEVAEREELGIVPACWHDSCHGCVVDRHKRSLAERVAARSDESYTPGGDNATYTTPEGYDDSSLANVLDLEMGPVNRTEVPDGSNPSKDYSTLQLQTPAATPVREQHPDRPHDQLPGATGRGSESPSPLNLFGSQRSDGGNNYSPAHRRQSGIQNAEGSGTPMEVQSGLTKW